MTKSGKTLLLIGVDSKRLLSVRLALQSPGVKLAGVAFAPSHLAEDVRQTEVLLQAAALQEVPLAVCEAAQLSPVQCSGHVGAGVRTDGAVALPLTAAELIVSQASRHRGELVVVVLGALSDLAKALAIDPELPGKLAGVVFHGGAICVPGDVTMVAEANVYADPEAAAYVLAANLPLLIVPLDATRTGSLAPEQLDRLEASIAVMAALHPELVQRERLKLSVECQSQLSRGALLADRRAIPRVGHDAEVCLEADVEQILRRAADADREDAR
ncbi:nucleoside hydrolase [Brevibacillus composti]|uniref:Nucleoside hydrolase n=1 Tax=Brevibacillus composti TaxID=2796470 RepID=A0A7T5JML3_9BACL|nr:nucleoside hydrolase [Brevibacillus composti]QQE73483.1 nucleoside hydrolase [Brevibacillus composti]QUO40565.1 nucleoside hydrolase [Brevibacillus composti]